MVICCFPLGFKALLEKADSSLAQALQSGYKMLTSPSEMGANSKCLALYRMDFPGQQPRDVQNDKDCSTIQNSAKFGEMTL